MHRYKVLASDPQSAIVALLDQSGRCHIGRATGAPPPPGALLVGDAPAVGLRSLRIATGDDPCPVSMAVIDCHPVAAVCIATGM